MIYIRYVEYIHNLILHVGLLEDKLVTGLWILLDCPQEKSST